MHAHTYTHQADVLVLCLILLSPFRLHNIYSSLGDVSITVKNVDNDLSALFCTFLL